MQGKKIVRKLFAVASAAALSVAVLIQGSVTADAAGFTGTDIAAKAVTYQGVPYVSGGIGRSGVDCSGFVYSVLTEMGFANIPRAQAGWWNVSGITYQGNPVQIQQLDASNPSYEAKPGDILVYQGHVCISMGRPGTWIDNSGNSYGDIRSYVAAIAYRFSLGNENSVSVQETTTATVEQNSMQKTTSGTVNAVSEEAEPKIKAIQISEQSALGYRVTVQISNLQNVSQIYFPTWTNSGWQDDITWESGNVNGDTVSYYVSASEHGNRNDIYYTHIHMYDQNGNLTIDGSQINGLN